MKFTAIKDVVGFMKNINAETLCKVQLQVQADSDRLTELYNSGAGKDRIQYLLKLRKMTFQEILCLFLTLIILKK